MAWPFTSDPIASPERLAADRRDRFNPPAEVAHLRKLAADSRARAASETDPVRRARMIRSAEGCEAEAKNWERYC